MMTKLTQYTNHFLLAAPRIDGGMFHQSLVYICRHDRDGVLGLIINKPLHHTNASKLFEELDIDVTAHDLHRKLALEGGPVNPEVGFVLHTGQPNWASSFAITENVCITTSKDILQSIAAGHGVEHYELCLGHASWAKGQLEQELAQGDWFVLPASIGLLFDTAYEARWQTAADQLGINADRLTMDIGHA